MEEDLSSLPAGDAGTLVVSQESRVLRELRVIGVWVPFGGKNVLWLYILSSLRWPACLPARLACILAGATMSGGSEVIVM